MRNVGGAAVILGAVAIALSPRTAGAQVGHNPGSSPYHDLRAKQAASVIAGFMRGQRGTPNAGPTNGPVLGVRYDRQVGTAAEILLGISYARLEKFLVDPTQPAATRLLGPFQNDVVFMETGVSLVLTGRKSWRGFVPYIGGMGGVVFETDLSTLSQFTFGTRLALTPHVGIKWYPVQAIAFKIEARDVIWRVRYPDAWFSSQAAGIPPVLTGTDKSAEWLHQPTLMVSLGYTFTY